MRLILLSLVLAASPSLARADVQLLGDLDAVHAACARASERGPRELYAIDLEPGWRFGRPAPDDERVPLDTRENLRALEGRVSLLPAGLEVPAFGVAEQALAYVVEPPEGARLRLLFFLGLDGGGRSSCLVRNRHAVTTVRFEAAAFLLRDARGRALARGWTDRLRVWREERAARQIPGEGPRGAVGDARFTDGRPVPEGWQRALERQREALGPCHAEGLERGARPEGQVMIRLNVESRTGRARRADVVVSSIGDAEASACMARALGAAGLTPGPTGWPEVVDVHVPVRLRAD